MSRWTELVGELSEADADALFAAGAERALPSGSTLVERGSALGAMYFLIRGLCEVRLESGAPIASLGPGEIIGDMSFLDGEPASAKVVAAEDAVVLEVPHAALRGQMARNPGFAADFYRTLGAVLSRRLRRALDQLGSAAGDLERAQSWIRARAILDGFKERLVSADKLAMSGAVPVEELARDYEAFGATMGAILDAEPDATIAAELGRRVQRELLPYLLMTKVAERMYSKPRGYAGDYLTLDLIYDNAAGGSGRLGPLLDRCFLADRPARAVRSRRRLMAAEIARSVEAARGGPVHVMAIACGPARELLDVMPSAPSLVATLVDFDHEALELVAREADRLGVADRVKLVAENPIYLAIGRKKLELAPVDLLYSIGLIDYTNDKVVVRLMDYAHGALGPGGRVILGNFHPANRSKALMDHLLEWQLIHRSEADMDRLYAKSKFGKPSTRFSFEDEGIDLFAECVK